VDINANPGLFSKENRFYSSLKVDNITPEEFVADIIKYSIKRNKTIKIKKY